MLLLDSNVDPPDRAVSQWRTVYNHVRRRQALNNEAPVITPSGVVPERSVVSYVFDQHTSLLTIDRSARMTPEGGRMYQKILVPLDGSDAAECVFPYVQAITRAYDEVDVVLVRVIGPLPVPARN